MSKCSVCDHPQTEKIEQHLMNDKPKEEIAELFDVDEEDVRDHLMNHMDSSFDREDIDEAGVDKVDLVIKKVMQTNNRLDTIISMTDDQAPDKRETDQISAISRELRNWVKLLNGMEDEIEKRREITEKQFDELLDFVLTELNDDKQKELLDKIEEVKEEVN